MTPSDDSGPAPAIPEPAIGLPAGPDHGLATALLESRARWRDLALLGADLLFETDGEGRLTFVAPDRPLGHGAEALLGRRLSALLAEPSARDPFAEGPAPRGLRLKLRGADGGIAWLEFAAMRSGDGLRGIARDVTEEERHAEAAARALRRATAAMRLLGDARRGQAGASASAAIARLLDGLGQALGTAGAALLEAAPAWRVAAQTGHPGGMPGAPQGPAALLPLAEGAALAVWRDTPLDEDETALLAALAPSLGGLRAEATRQRALDEAARTDPLTGLLNRRGFADALRAGRRRQAEGVLAYLDMDGLKRLNDAHGHAAGDRAIRALAARLAAVAHPGAVAARLGGDEFALWLPGLAAEEAWAVAAPLGAPAPLPGLPEAGEAAIAASIGLAVATAADEAAQLLSRADVAMYRRKTDRRAA